METLETLGTQCDPGESIAKKQKKRVLLDAFDLINILEHDRPLSFEDFRSEIESRRLEVVVGMMSVFEILPRRRSSRVWELIIDRLDSLPHTFFRHAELRPLELRAALEAFGSPTPKEPVPISANRLFVDRWFDTFWENNDLEQVLAKVELDRIVGLGLKWQVRQLAPLVELIDRDPRRSQDRFRANLADERRQFGLKKDHWSFTHAVIESLKLETTIPWPADVSAFASWLREDPRKAPGWRLMVAAREEMRVDQHYKPSRNALRDLSHLQLIPYVDFATVDGSLYKGYFDRALRTLEAFAPVNYRPKTFMNVTKLLAAI